MADRSHIVVVQGTASPQDRRGELAAGLMARPAQIAPKFFYDTQGCALYEAIVALDEYYLPRTEAAIFERAQREIAAALPREAQFVDLGCGDGAKALRWLEPLQVRRYVGVDIAPDWLRSALARGAARFPATRFDGIVTDFTRGLDIRAQLEDTPRIFFYPGSSIGNFDPPAATRLLADIRRHLGPRDRLLIAADAPKARETLVAAYDDALGVTAAFNRNVLRVVNRELDADIPLAAFAHRAVFNEPHSRIEMHLVATRPVRVRLGEFGERRFEHGEAIVTEHSYKYSARRFMELLAAAGFGDVRRWSDDQGGYGVYVAAGATER
jgi:dimethylhistidine N-methyltransferase